MTQDGPPVGLVLGSALPPERCVEIARGRLAGLARGGLLLHRRHRWTTLGATKRIPGGPREVLPRLG